MKWAPQSLELIETYLQQVSGVKKVLWKKVGRLPDESVRYVTSTFRHRRLPPCGLGHLSC